MALRHQTRLRLWLLVLITLGVLLLVLSNWPGTWKITSTLTDKQKPPEVDKVNTRVELHTKAPSHQSRTDSTNNTAPGPDSVRVEQRPPKHRYDSVKVHHGTRNSWTFNQTAKSRIQRYLNSGMNAGEFSVLTKKFAKMGLKIGFASANESRSLDSQVYDSLPTKSPFAGANFKRCSVVGNGGILLKSHCGRDIDQADYIFRCNAPPIRGHEEDAGTKTNLSSINPNSVIADKYRRLSGPGDRYSFLWDMKRYGDLLISVYGVASGYKHGALALKLLKKSSTIRALVVNPDHFRAVQSLWQQEGLTSRMTTGLYLTSVALSVCETVHLYGFWPFPNDAEMRPVPYHYYDKMRITSDAHNFTWEFNTLDRLHKEGALRLHTAPCDDVA